MQKNILDEYIQLFSDLPGHNDFHRDILITGVESEEVEGINEAYEDLLLELGEFYLYYFPSAVSSAGLSRHTEDDFPELMSSCFPLLLLDCICVRMADCFTALSQDKRAISHLS